MQIRSVGIDLGKTTFHLVALGDNGRVLLKKKFTQKQLIAFHTADHTFGKFEIDRLPWRSKLPQTPCQLNRSMQHWLGVYSPAFQSPRSFAGVDSGAELPC
jgi:hypothetical protein